MYTPCSNIGAFTLFQYQLIVLAVDLKYQQHFIRIQRKRQNIQHLSDKSIEDQFCASKQSLVGWQSVHHYLFLKNSFPNDRDYDPIATFPMRLKREIS